MTEEDDPLYRDPALASFYDLENDWSEDQAFCARLAEGAASVLDLGCGTGALIARLAEGRRAVGVDPAEAMLAVARGRPGGAGARWVAADARGLELGERFELVVMTGHAFQVFLTEADQAAALATIARHLAPGGRFVFDTRNPARREWEEWTPALSGRRVEHPSLGAVEAWNDVAFDGGSAIATYGTHYRLADGRVLSARSRIAFPEKESMAALIAAVGLSVEAWLGDWTGAAWAPEAPEIIPLGRLP